MTGANSPEDPEALRAEAADWFVRVQSDAAGEVDWLALEAWLAGSPARRAVFGEVELLWRELDDHGADLRMASDPARPAVVVDLASRRRKPAPSRPQWRGWAVAASLAILAFGAWLLRPPSLAPQIFATTTGASQTVQLADGSKVQLNSATRLVARVDRIHRQVTLEGGEAIFDVAKDPVHPFTVDVGDQRVTVVGTQFDILRNAGRIAVTVSRGVVEVAPARAGSIAAKARLTPGDQLRHVEGAPTSEISKVPADDVLAWRSGYVVYRSQTLADVVTDLNRYFRTPIRVEGPAAQLTFSGALMTDSEDAVIRRLETFLPIKAVRTADRITLRLR